MQSGGKRAGAANITHLLDEGLLEVGEILEYSYGGRVFSSRLAPGGDLVGLSEGLHDALFQRPTSWINACMGLPGVARSAKTHTPGYKRIVRAADPAVSLQDLRISYARAHPEGPPPLPQNAGRSTSSSRSRSSSSSSSSEGEVVRKRARPTEGAALTIARIRVEDGVQGYKAVAEILQGRATALAARFEEVREAAACLLEGLDGVPLDPKVGAFARGLRELLLAQEGGDSSDTSSSGPGEGGVEAGIVDSGEEVRVGQVFSQALVWGW